MHNNNMSQYSSDEERERCSSEEEDKRGHRTMAGVPPLRLELGFDEMKDHGIYHNLDPHVTHLKLSKCNPDDWREVGR